MNDGARIQLLADRNTLANRWREQAERHELMARQYLNDGDHEAAREHEACATDFYTAADELEGLVS